MSLKKQPANKLPDYNSRAYASAGPKPIGILGVTAEGASLCYRTIVSSASSILGANKHPEILLINSSFDEIKRAQDQKDWQGVATILARSAKKLKAAGASFGIIPANSVHYAYQRLIRLSPIPILNLTDIVCNQCVDLGWKRVAILGVGLTMTDGLYNRPLRSRGIIPYLPTPFDQAQLNRIIYTELVLSIIKKDSTAKILAILKRLCRSCDGAILACTELPLVITSSNAPLPVIDTTRLLAKHALAHSLEEA